MQNDCLDVMRLRGKFFCGFHGPMGKPAPIDTLRLPLDTRLTLTWAEIKYGTKFNATHAMSLVPRGTFDAMYKWLLAVKASMKYKEPDDTLYRIWHQMGSKDVLHSLVFFTKHRTVPRMCLEFPELTESHIPATSVVQHYSKPSVEWQWTAGVYGPQPSRSKLGEQLYKLSIRKKTRTQKEEEILPCHSLPRPNLKHKVPPEVREYWTRQPSDRLPLAINKHGRYTDVIMTYVDCVPRPPNTDFKEVRTSRHLADWYATLQSKATNCIDTIGTMRWKAANSIDDGIGTKGLSGGWKEREVEDVRKTPLKYWRARRLARKMTEDFRAAKAEKKKVRKAKKWARIGCQTYAQWQESMGLRTSSYCED